MPKRPYPHKFVRYWTTWHLPTLAVSGHTFSARYSRQGRAFPRGTTSGCYLWQQCMDILSVATISPSTCQPARQAQHTDCCTHPSRVSTPRTSCFGSGSARYGARRQERPCVAPWWIAPGARNSAGCRWKCPRPLSHDRPNGSGAALEHRDYFANSPRHSPHNFWRCACRGSKTSYVDTRPGMCLRWSRPDGSSRCAWTRCGSTRTPAYRPGCANWRIVSLWLLRSFCPWRARSRAGGGRPAGLRA